jgi:hypothetical protein
MWMRRLAAAAAGSALCATAVIAQDAMATLGLRPDQAKAALFEVLGTGRLNDQGAKQSFLNAATAEARVALVNGALTWAKEYTSSPEFGKRYATARAQAEPRLAMGRKWSADEELGRRQALLDQRIAAEKKRLEDPPPPRQTPEQQQARRTRNEERIRNMETERARYDDPAARAEMRKALDAEDQRYEEEHAEWEENYPVDSRAAIAGRLRYFLALSATVDFDAKLVPCRTPRGTCRASRIPPTRRSRRSGSAVIAPEAAGRSRAAFAASWLRELETK